MGRLGRTRADLRIDAERKTVIAALVAAAAPTTALWAVPLPHLVGED
jgi:hypothetical protein